MGGLHVPGQGGGFGSHPGSPTIDKILTQLLYEMQQIRFALVGNPNAPEDSPFRQGIAHHQARIARAMEAEVEMLGNTEVSVEQVELEPVEEWPEQSKKERATPERQRKARNPEQRLSDGYR